MQGKAPIAFFAYKRPIHAKASLESLSRCEGAEESELFIFSDGAKGEGDRKGVEEVRKVIASRKWCGRVNIIERDKNLGLAASIISGVTGLCEKYGRVIVLEDDIIVSRYFLDYLNTALDRYEDEERVMQVTGHMFPIKFKSETDAVFFPIANSQGWATWQRAWKDFDREMKGYEELKKDAALRKRFDLDGSYPYFEMCEAQKEGKVDSWAIRWYLSVFMKGGLGLFPVKSLLENIGFDPEGTHTKNNDNFYGSASEDFRVTRFPSEVRTSEEAFKELKRFLKKRQNGPLTRVREVLNAIFRQSK